MDKCVWADMVIPRHPYLAYVEKQIKMQQNKTKCSRTRKNDPAIMPRLFYYSNFFNGFLTLGLDSSFNKCALLTCRRLVKRISWNKFVLLHFCDKTLPFSKTILGFLSLVWWESQFTVESRSHVLSESGSIVIGLFTYVWCNEGEVGSSKKKK